MGPYDPRYNIFRRTPSFPDFTLNRPKSTQVETVKVQPIDPFDQLRFWDRCITSHVHFLFTLPRVVSRNTRALVLSYSGGGTDRTPEGSNLGERERGRTGSVRSYTDRPSIHGSSVCRDPGVSTDAPYCAGRNIGSVGRC